MTADDLHDRLDAAASAIQADVVAWRHRLHQHPELSNREERTAAFIAEQLRAFGVDEVIEQVAGHGVVGVLRGGQGGTRTIALRADIDALPVKEDSGVDFASTVVDENYPGGPFPVAHACGHDCHTAMLLGAAHVLTRVRESLGGTVLFVFQPAEEGPPIGEDGGAAAMLRSGVLDPFAPSMAFGMHVVPGPKGYVAVRTGPQYAASALVRITITGAQVHGSTPWMGVDPMPAAAAVIQAVGQLYRQVPATEPVTISIGHVEDVGRFNIIGERVCLYGTARVLSPTVMEDVQRRLTRTVEHTAQAYGCTGTAEFLQPVPAVVHDPAWVDAAMPSLRRVVGDRIGEIPPTLGYDDVSEFIDAYGGVYIMLGVQDVDLDSAGRPSPTPGGRGVAPNHSPKFYADDDTLQIGVRLHAHVAVDHLAGALAVSPPGA
ncbi:M20 metallopeptidase family protein [Gordonia sp. (in: high G+C Gram-positive bacteria)]|uniref:M20 metallopeptidase family protein n=1 Tax=Gordonia sp. (in: high G+C Gram-positive bacteria) TaxID=84139 RepID=UPI003C7064B2